MKRNKCIYFCILLLILTLNSTFVSSFGISVPYLKNDTIKMEPGQDYVLTLTIQNSEKKELNLQFEYNITGEIATLREHEKIIPPETYDTKYAFDIHMPETAVYGNTYILEFRGRPLIDTGGQAPMTVELRRKIYIKTVSEGGEGTIIKELSFSQKTWNLFVGILEKFKIPLMIIIVLLLIAFVLLKFWKISDGISSKIIKKRKHSPTPLSDAKSVSELIRIIKKMPTKQYKLSSVRKIISKKLDELGETKASEKSLKSKSKRDLLKIFK